MVCSILRNTFHHKVIKLKTERLRPLIIIFKRSSHQLDLLFSSVTEGLGNADLSLRSVLDLFICYI